jgi:hypothetical protein
MINHLCAHHKRTMFACGRNDGDEYTTNTGADPLYQWKLDDDWDNGRIRTYRILAMPRTSAPGGAGGDAEAYVEGSSSDTTGDMHTGTEVWTSPVYPQDLRYIEIRYSRGAKGGAETTDGITVANGYTICDIAVCDEWSWNIDDSNEVGAPANGPWAGDEVLANRPKAIAEAFHKFRTLNMPLAFSWSANNCTNNNNPSNPSASGIPIKTATMQNICDSTVTARSATSPGIFCPGYKAGRGDSGLTVGASVKVQCRVLAKNVDSGSTATVRFQGPNHAANNYTDISIPVGANPAWAGTTSNYIKLNTNAEDDDATLAMNKIDILAQAVDASNYLYIYAVCGWLEWGDP